MKITNRDISEYASRIIGLLDALKVYTRERMDELQGQKYQIFDKGNDYVEFSMRPSNLQTRAHTISYVSSGTGIPVEARMNFTLGHTKIFVKSSQLLEGYTESDLDTFHNFTQTRTAGGTSVRLARLYLAELVEAGRG